MLLLAALFPVLAASKPTLSIFVGARLCAVASGQDAPVFFGRDDAQCDPVYLSTSLKTELTRAGKGTPITVLAAPGATGGPEAAALATSIGFTKVTLGTDAIALTWPASVPATEGPSGGDELAAAALLQAVMDAVKRNDPAAAVASARDTVRLYPTTRAGGAATRILVELELIGQPAPALQVDRWIQSAADLKGAAVTVLFFGESWCPHTQRELPLLVAKQATLQERGAQIVWLTRLTKEATEESMRALIAKEHVSFPVAVETANATSLAYGVTGIPAMAVIANGVIVFRGHPARFTEELMTTLIPPGAP